MIRQYRCVVCLIVESGYAFGSLNKAVLETDKNPKDMGWWYDLEEACWFCSEHKNQSTTYKRYGKEREEKRNV